MLNETLSSASLVEFLHSLIPKSRGSVSPGTIRIQSYVFPQRIAHSIANGAFQTRSIQGSASNFEFNRWTLDSESSRHFVSLVLLHALPFFVTGKKVPSFGEILRYRKKSAHIAPSIDLTSTIVQNDDYYNNLQFDKILNELNEDRTYLENLMKNPG